jgi:hypothetical protein
MEYEDNSKRSTENVLYIPPMPKFATNTPVTEEAFLTWKRKFEAELYEQKKLAGKALDDDAIIKISGR